MEFEHLASVTSTNAVAKQRASDGLGERVIMADVQTAGRGRMTRKFESPPDGLYFSVLLRRDISASELLKLTSLAAVAASVEIEKLTGIRTDIKWVNDLLLDGKKVCGILTECGFGERGIEYIVIGIGINTASAPKGVEGAGGLGCVDIDREALARNIATHISDGISGLKNGDFLPEYRRRMCLTGSDVFVIKDDIRREARVRCVEDDCALTVEYTDGETEALRGFEISVRRK